MIRYLLILFIAVPLLELYVLLKISEFWGAFPTIILVIVTGVTGAFLAKSQGTAAWRRIQSEFYEGRMPGDQLLDGLMIFAGGITLLTPGLITDTIGLCLLIPLTRNIIKRLIKQKILRKLKERDIGIIIDQPPGHP
jgi:UPF0716 protein FxsA